MLCSPFAAATIPHESNVPAPGFSWPIFLLGCVGAAAPEIVRLYNLRTEAEFTWRWFYLMVSVLFVPLGGLIAWILPATSYWGAFYVGVSMPVIISSIGRDRGAKPKKRTKAPAKKEVKVKESKTTLRGPMIGEVTHMLREQDLRKLFQEPEVEVEQAASPMKDVVSSIRSDFFNAI
jgi:hypothetical protein